MKGVIGEFGQGSEYLILPIPATPGQEALMGAAATLYGIINQIVAITGRSYSDVYRQILTDAECSTGTVLDAARQALAEAVKG